MHPYATDSTERRNVIAVLVVISLVLAWSGHAVWTALGLPLSWWMDTPSALALFGLFFKLFDRWVWRWRIWRKVRLLHCPDLSGHWKGELRSSHDDFVATHDVIVNIAQNWTTISVTLGGHRSDSESLNASLYVGSPKGPTLTHTYRNTPKVDARDTMHSHLGTASLVLGVDGRLEGEYYTGRDRCTQGTMALRRQAN